MFKGKGIFLIIGLSYLLTPLNVEVHEHEHLHVGHNHMVKKENAPILEENVQTFEGEDGTHNIYWAKGVNAPKMTYDSSKYGQDGYFDKETEINGAVTYVAEMKPGNGYYDLNKNRSRMGDKDHIGDESPHCYLNSSSNLILWWLEQNKDLVTTYVDRLLNSDIYGQPDNLIHVFPGERTMWEKMYAEPGIAKIDGYYRQESGLTNLVKENLSPYYRRYHDGFIPDKVWDFFFNGYPNDASYAGYDILPQNKEDNFKRDPLGGYFFNIFENHMLTERFELPEHKHFEWYENNLRTFFAEGKALNLGYLFASGSQAHAITVWGAEYGPNNELLRIFVTDSDDIENTANNKGTFTRGLHSMNTKRNEAGRMIIGNNPGKYEGALIQNITTLALNREEFEARLNDIDDPVAPDIIKTSEDRVYGLNGNYNVSVEAKVSDTGTLNYQWYVSDSLNAPGKALVNENKPSLKINTNEIGIKYYYCEVSNLKNGKVETTTSKYIKADVQNIPLVHAATPVVRFNTGVVEVNQYSKPPRFEVFASSPDNGKLTYQWYRSNDSYARNGFPIEGATKPYFYPPTTESARLFYYCVITNTKYGPEITGNNQTSIATQFSKCIKISPSELINAKAPLIMEISNDANYKIGDEIAPLYVEAKSYDGGKLSFQWNEVDEQGNINIIPGANSQSYLPIVNNSGVHKYSCTITNTNENAKEIKDKSITTSVINIKIESDYKPSNDNKLKVLKINNAVISPNFSADINNYTANVAHNISKLDIEAIANEKAKINIINPNLIPGETTNIKIEVTSESGLVNTYSIGVTRDGTHNFGDWKIVNESTCTKTGLRIKTCIDCGYNEKEIIPKKDHLFSEWKTTKIATEEQDGLEVRTCSVCGETESRIIPKLEHTHKFGDWYVTKPATCTDDGIETRKCKCGLEETRTIKATGHKFGEWITTKLPTEFETGLETRTCSLCGESETRVIPKLEHTHNFGEWVLTTPPTCTKDGIETRTCSCGLTETRVVKTTGHNFGNWVLKTAPTEEQEGLEVRTCSVCGESETRIIPKLEHTHKFGEWVLTTPPTCTKDGIETRTCSCGLTETRVVKATGHNFGEWETIKEPTYDEEGIETRTCSICGETETRSIPKIEKPITPELPETPSENKPNDNSKTIAIVAGVAIPLSVIAILALFILINKKR